MSETGDFELFGAPAAKESSEAGDEQFREEMRQTQAAVKQLQKEEGKAKAQDNNLAGIIVQFLGQPQNTDLFLLISRVVAQNVPSEFILALISLIDEAAHQEVTSYLTAGKLTNPIDATALAINPKTEFSSLPPEHKGVIDAWVKQLNESALHKPHRMLETAIQRRPEPMLSEPLVQLGAFILRRYMEKYRVEYDFDHLRDFFQSVLLEIIKNAEGLLEGQKQIKA